MRWKKLSLQFLNDFLIKDDFVRLSWVTNSLLLQELKMQKKVLVPLAKGFEEIEAIVIIDVLRRAGIDVVTASVSKRDTAVTGAHSIPIVADILLSQIKEEKFDMIVLPGGMPGAKNLAESDTLVELLKKQFSSARFIGAICAAPAVVLQSNDLLGKEKVACYPSFRENINESNRSNERLHVGDQLITGAGPGVAIEFSLSLVEKLVDRKMSEGIRNEMLV